MPYSVIKKGDKYQLKNKNTGVIVNKLFLSRATAIRVGKNYHRYSTKNKKRKTY
jgi:hypothetical protein